MLKNQNSQINLNGEFRYRQGAGITSSSLQSLAVQMLCGATGELQASQSNLGLWVFNKIAEEN